MIRSSEQFADYRDQFLSWEACEPQVADYCQKLGFVKNLKRWLTEVALEVDRTKPENHALVITEKGEPVLKKPLRKPAPRGFAKLETAVAERMQESYVLDILCRIDYWTKWTRHPGPFSGADPKMEDAQARYILTAFAYASHLGPYQLARHFHGSITEDVLVAINRRHVTIEKLKSAIRDIMNRFNCCPLPRCWGMGKRVAADGTQHDLAEENLLVEKHIRYGGFGGVASHHVSDRYILLFSPYSHNQKRMGIRASTLSGGLGSREGEMEYLSHSRLILQLIVTPSPRK